MLPDIGGHRRKPQMGESFQSMGRMSGAAGFNRDNVPSRGMPGAGSTGFSYQDPGSGAGVSRFGGDEQVSTGGGRRSIRMAGGNTASEVSASIDKDRPPLYVPQRRESGADRSRAD